MNHQDQERRIEDFGVISFLLRLVGNGHYGLSGFFFGFQCQVTDGGGQYSIRITDFPGWFGKIDLAVKLSGLALEAGH